jgi:hypothetical protein
MRRKLRVAMMLSAEEWWVLVQAWVVLLAVDLGLRLLHFKAVQARVARAGERAREQDGDEATIRRVGWLVGIAARYHLVAMSCLRRALALQWLFERRGVATDLRFGVRREAGDLNAHAWLEHAGRPIGEPTTVATHYVPLVAQEAGR